MVRVISVHHFANQAVQTVEQPTACTVARNRLLLALSNQTIEVRDLAGDGAVLFAFPTVDEVTQLLFCPNGNFIVTLETKHNRQNRALRFARVYVRWDSVATWQQSKMTRGGVTLGATSECGMVQPMRARIAGRVTPTTAQSELGSLEMIELASKRNPNAIAVCRISGNILLASQTTITIYEFRVKVHDISKLRFIDFEEFPCLIELNFAPTKLAFAENYIACMSKDKMHMFKVVFNNNAQKEMQDSMMACEDLNFNNYSPDECLDYAKIMLDERQKIVKDKITINLPSVVRENSAIHKSSPFTVCDKSMTATIKSNSPIENRPQSFSIINLIQIRLKTISCENGSKQIVEQFKCLELKALYIDEQLNRKSMSTSKRHLRSDYHHLLHSVACLIVTQQEGYMYQFSDNDDSNMSDHCISVYPFTAPIYQIVLEDYFLHAITEAGLESYTVRNINELCHDLEQLDITAACPPITDSICLVGLRPFLGVEKLLLAENYLVLLASADSSPTHSVGSSSSSSTAAYWTLYSLELPTPRNVYNDMSIVASSHRFTSAQTYCHLLSEAHMILRSTLLLKHFVPIEMDIGLLNIVKNNTEDVVEVYRASCALLGDHYIMCNVEKEYQLAVPYYKMGVVNPFDALKRVNKIQEQSNNNNVTGLIYYLTVILFDVKFICDIDKLFSVSSKQSFIEAILDLFNKHNYSELPNLILKSRAVREYSTEKLLNMLKRVENDEKLSEKSLALCILHLQKSNFTNAQNYLQKIEQDQLNRVLNDNWDLLFEYNSTRKGQAGSFSELTTILMNRQAILLSNILIELVVKRKCLTLNKLLKAFIEYLPSSDSTCAGRVLQSTIELYLKHFYDRYENRGSVKIVYDRGTHEALKLLVRSYLSQLQLLQLKEKSTNDKGNILVKDDYLFADIRYAYLNEMPPFQSEATAKLSEKSSNCANIDTEANLILKKLQALLCSQTVPNQVLIEANTFLNLNENLCGNVSLQSIIMTVNDGVQFLIEECPQCLLQFAKDRFIKVDEWKSLVANIQRYIIRLCQDKDQHRLCYFFKKILKDILTHVATNMTLEQLLEVFPQHMQYSTSCLEPTSLQTSMITSTTTNVINGSDLTSKDSDNQVDILNEIQNYEPYINMCKETMHANQIKKLIAATGQQLLSTLNL